MSSPCAAISSADARAELGVEAAQQALAAVGERRLDAQAVEDRGELERDVAAADHQRARGSRSRWNASFEVMACSMPAIGGSTGQEPVATRMCFA
jgi:hypothetical protein